MGKLFGTDGIRGKANKWPMIPEVALQVGRAVGHIFKNHRSRHKVLIGKDTRLSGYLLENAIASGLCSMGAEAIFVGPMPTPAIAFLTVDMRCDAGIVISASHNPYYDNGIKIFGSDGFKLSDELEEKIEDMVLNDTIASFRAEDEKIGKAYRIEDAPGRYVVHLKNTFPREENLEGIKIVLDCANGAAYKVAPSVFEELGAEVIKVGVSPNGLNINDGCGALYPENISRLVRDNHAHIGLALDGDADRLIVVDEKGRVVDGDQILALCAEEMQKEGALKGNTVVATVMSNMGLEKALAKMGLKLLRTKVGDRFVVEAMKENGYNLGGEQSGHIIFLDYATTGDGILAALQVLAIMKKRGRPLSELANLVEKYPQVLVNVKVKERIPKDEIAGLNELIARIEKELGDEGRVLIRPSGTEPKYRVMVEGQDEEKIKAYAEELAAHIRTKLS
ncbi:phosphoglucosamine mutase [Thermodesulfatator autotrophicus]|uniref:Phosphoglucosamine mutase n=1 Tax=Thermodesulfatator autotrophicus TaxID=1795632 RepID=A0A177E7H4_9BACT|nr:phosphoglucosamine mutase [Thermodesulfatator autotrophicus]OAG27903.1 phosphoglucosamine mutase [Thermodesulfatator autotrophicus]